MNNFKNSIMQIIFTRTNFDFTTHYIDEPNQENVQNEIVHAGFQPNQAEAEQNGTHLSFCNTCPICNTVLMHVK